MLVLLADLSPISGIRNPKPLGKDIRLTLQVLMLVFLRWSVAHHWKTNSQTIGKRCLSKYIGVMMVLLANLSPISGRQTPKPLGKDICQIVQVLMLVLLHWSVAHQWKTNSQVVEK